MYPISIMIQMATLSYVLELEKKLYNIQVILETEEDEDIVLVLMEQEKTLEEEMNTIKSSTSYILDLQDFLDATDGTKGVSWADVFKPVQYLYERQWALQELKNAQEKNKGRWSPTLFHCYECRNGKICQDMKITKMIKSE